MNKDKSSLLRRLPQVGPIKNPGSVFNAAHRHMYRLAWRLNDNLTFDASSRYCQVWLPRNIEIIFPLRLITASSILCTCSSDWRMRLGRFSYQWIFYWVSQVPVFLCPSRRHCHSLRSSRLSYQLCFTSIDDIIRLWGDTEPDEMQTFHESRWLPC